MIKKRSVTIAGHTTSVSLEEDFWLVLKDMANHREVSLNALITQIDIDHGAGKKNLSSALRVAALHFVQSKSF